MLPRALHYTYPYLLLVLTKTSKCTSDGCVRLSKLHHMDTWLALEKQLRP